MRRLLLSATVLMPLAVFLGCSHMAGKCDCDSTPTLACPCYNTHTVPVVPTPALKPVEPIKPKPDPDK